MWKNEIDLTSGLKNQFAVHFEIEMQTSCRMNLGLRLLKILGYICSMGQYKATFKHWNLFIWCMMAAAVQMFKILLALRTAWWPITKAIAWNLRWTWIFSICSPIENLASCVGRSLNNLNHFIHCKCMHCPMKQLLDQTAWAFQRPNAKMTLNFLGYRMTTYT